MNILIVHNYYLQPGGEDEVVAAEMNLLRERGHDVDLLAANNRDLESEPKAATALRTVWSSRFAKTLEERLTQQRFDLVHFHNFFPRVSPASYYACRRASVPVVQSLHNYRLTCLPGTFFRDGGPCEDCLGKAVPWPGVVHRCYRDSRVQSGVVASMITVHRTLNTWRRMVDLFITPSNFARSKLLQAGLPPERVLVKSHFLDDDPGPGSGDGDYALYVGRLSVDKGVRFLLQAWASLRNEIPLKIVGDGDLRDEVVAAAQTEGIDWLGQRPLDEVLELMGRAKMLVLPSLVYETFGRTIMEAYARGTPVLGSGHGAIAEGIDEGVTGCLFEPGDANDLVARARALNGRSLDEMRGAARAEFERKYTAPSAYEALMNCYARALDR